jgi:hypothetical protein
MTDSVPSVESVRRVILDVAGEGYPFLPGLLVDFEAAIRVEATSGHSECEANMDAEIGRLTGAIEDGRTAAMLGAAWASAEAALAKGYHLELYGSPANGYAAWCVPDGRSTDLLDLCGSGDDPTKALRALVLRMTLDAA